MPVLEIRVTVSPGDVELDVLCAGYELGKWRETDLVGDLFDRHLLTFALNYSEAASVGSATALKSIREAALSVYSTEKYARRGEFGELLLHGALVDFYGAVPAVSKIYYEDSSNDVVKGFDSVHLVLGDPPRIWLGEAKFYQDAKDAVDAALLDVKAHLEPNFLRREFMFISRKVDDQWPEAEQFQTMIASARSLDEIAPSIVMPVFLTYDSDAVNANNVLSPEYVDELQLEAELILQRFEGKLAKPLEVEIRLILLPMKSKAALINLMHRKLEALRGV